jgi:hypothetical protein
MKYIQHLLPFFAAITLSAFGGQTVLSSVSARRTFHTPNLGVPDSDGAVRLEPSGSPDVLP